MAYPLLVDESGRPLGWLSERGLQGERVVELTSRSETVIELDDILRDALSDLLAEEAQYGPWWTSAARSAASSRSRSSPTPSRLPPTRCPRGRRGGVILELAQVQIRDRTDTCESNNGFCPDWIADNFDRYVDPFFQHAYLTVLAVAIGFAISFSLALVAYRRRWLINPITQVTGILYTVPSIAAFFLLLPITGRGNDTALIALVAYVLLIIFRNVLAGLDNVPDETKDAGRGMGLTDSQLLWSVEVPLALPEIMAGLRIATTTTVGLATLAFFAGAGGLGEQIFSDITFKSNVVVAGGLAVVLAAVLDGLILLVQRAITPGRGWSRPDDHHVCLPRPVRRRDRVHLRRARVARRRRAGRRPLEHVGPDVGAPQALDRGDGDRLRHVDPAGPLARAHRQGRLPGDQRVERGARGAEPRPDRVLRGLRRRRLHQPGAGARPARDPRS